MLSRLIPTYERWHARRDTSRRAHPFSWGTEYLDGAAPEAPEDPAPVRTLLAHARAALGDSDAFYPEPGRPPGAATRVGEIGADGARRVFFPSAIASPDRRTNRAELRLWEPPGGGRGRAMVVLPQWNAEPDSHAALCRLLARRGVAAARLTLPYHEGRAPAGEPRGDLAVSANLGRTLAAVRQAVADARRGRAWLEARGYGRVGLLGTSLGSCISFLALAHDPRFRIAVLHHVSSHFGDVVWRGISTRHVRAELEPRVTRSLLARVWAPISPIHFVDKVSPESRSLLLMGRYDLSFPLDLSRRLERAFRERSKPHDAWLLPWGHYTSGVFPFNAWLAHRALRWIDAWL